jgi:hypothetical protein
MEYPTLDDVLNLIDELQENLKSLRRMLTIVPHVSERTLQQARPPEPRLRKCWITCHNLSICGGDQSLSHRDHGRIARVAE